MVKKKYFYTLSIICSFEEILNLFLNEPIIIDMYIINLLSFKKELQNKQNMLLIYKKISIERDIKDKLKYLVYFSLKLELFQKNILLIKNKKSRKILQFIILVMLIQS